jgi:WhiB family transcriptional regulator, redox-sensing transcriptional regulator
MFKSAAAREAFEELWDAIDTAPVLPACQTTDPDVWFPDGMGASYKQARTFCNRCPVKRKCLEFALINDEPAGMFGGLSPEERLQLKRKNGPHRLGRGRNAWEG